LTSIDVVEQRDEAAAVTPWQATRRRMAHHVGFKLGLGILVLMTLVAIFAPVLSPADPYTQILSERLMPPVWGDGGGWHYLLGTDHLGRDYLSRLIYGARVSIIIGLGAALLGALIGVTLGICAGYFGGVVDQIFSYLLTCQLALPSLLLSMALVFVIGPSLPVVILVLGFLHWDYYMIVTRSAALRLRELDFVAAARTLGCSRLQIILDDVLPNLVNQVIVIFTLEVGSAIIAEASLSFLGVGVPAPTPSWGLMIAEGRNAMFFRPWLVVIPGAVLFVLVIAINLMGDGLRDATATENRN
jgi:peptide/nickel transport system permease protein